MAGDALTGTCLCGAVTITATPKAREVAACHCSRCRRWTGSALFVFSAAPETVTVAGPAKVWDHEIAERAFCAECGTLLWLKGHGDDYEFQVGFFDEARGFPLVSEIYTDDAFAAIRLAGDHRKKTKAEYEADHELTDPAP